MSAFDPYHKWLGIPPHEQPAHHYRLLGVAPFESDADVIESAADRQMAYVRQCASGPYVKESQQILNELSAARVCLLTPSKKEAYDAELKMRLAGAQPKAPPAAAAGALSGGPLADFKLSEIKLAEAGRPEKSPRPPAPPAPKPRPGEEKKPSVEKKKSAAVRAAAPPEDDYELNVPRPVEPEVTSGPRRRARKKNPLPLKFLALAGVGLLAVIVVVSFKDELAELLANLSKPGAEAQPGGQVGAMPASDRNSPNRQASAKPLSRSEVDLDYKRRQELLQGGTSARAQPAVEAPTQITDDAGDDVGDSLPGDPPVSTEWTTADEWLVSSAAPLSTRALPNHPPEEFVVALRVRRLTGKNTFAIGVPVGGRQVLVALDAHAGTFSGLEHLDGKTVNANEAARPGRFLFPDREVTIRCTVSKQGITCTCDDATVVDWRGDLARLSLPRDFSVPDEHALFLATIGSRIAVRDIKVWPLGGKEPASKVDAGNALVGTWQTEGDYSAQGLKSRFEIKKTHGKWSMKLTFINRSKKVVGTAFGEEFRYSKGTLHCIQRYTQKPVADWADGLPITFHLERDDSNRMISGWSDPSNGNRGSAMLVRAKGK